MFGFGKVKDPVCGMKIKKKEAAATLEHEGETYYFCAEGCKEKFAENPEKYLSSEHEAESMEHESDCCR